MNAAGGKITAEEAKSCCETVGGCRCEREMKMCYAKIRQIASAGGKKYQFRSRVVDEKDIEELRAAGFTAELIVVPSGLNKICISW